jgi:uncharacterized protein
MADNIGTVNGLYEAFGRGDVAWILDQFDDEIEWDLGIRQTGLAYAQPGRGRQHVIGFFTALTETVEFTQFEPGAPCENGDVVMVPLMEAGRIIGGGEIPTNLVAHVWRFGANGKVVAFNHICDWALHEKAAAHIVPTVTA